MNESVPVNVKRATMRTIAITLLLVAIAATAHADNHDRDRKRERHESHNWIIERQQSGAVGSGAVPTLRRIRGGREIDVYRDGSMFEKNNFVGYDKR